MPASNAKVTLTATVKAGTVEKTKSFTLNLVVDVVDAAYALESGESLNGFTLTGVIGKIDDAYSEQFGNITVTIVIDNRVNQPIQCFRLKGEGCDTLAVGDKITVTGNIVNYNGTIEFNSGCTLDAKTTATAEEIAIAEFAFVELAKQVTENFTLPEGITWTVKEGTAITIDGVNATVVRGDADATVVITGTLNGHTRDFTVVVKATDGGTEPVEDVMTVAEALAAANALGKDEYSAEKVYVEGVIAEITKFDSGRSSYTFYIKDADGTDQLTVFSCKTTADITKIYVGDTVKVYGYLQNFRGNTPEVTYKGDENPVFVTLTRGTSTITVDEASSANAQVVELSAESGTNGTTFTFKVTVDEGYQIVSVKVNGETLTASAESVYTGTISGNTTIVVSTSLIGVTTNTVDAVIADMVADKGWTNATKVESPFTLDEVISVSYTGGANTGKYYASGSNIRIYQNESPTVTISAQEGYVITSVTVSYISDKTGTLVYNGENIAPDQAITLNGSSITFNVGNTNSSVTNGQVRITAISVTYQAV